MFTTLALAATFAVAFAHVAAAASTDTVDDVVRAAREAAREFSQLTLDLQRKAGQPDAKSDPEIGAQIAAIGKMQPVLSRLQGDRAFAKHVLDVSLKGDRAGLSALFAPAVAPDFQVRQIKDWYIAGTYEVNGYIWEYCISSDASCGRGKYAYHDMIGKAK